jgi:hypothetical protein
MVTDIANLASSNAAGPPAEPAESLPGTSSSTKTKSLRSKKNTTGG